MTKQIDDLGTLAAQMVMQGAADVLRQRGLMSADIDVDALCGRLRQRAVVVVHEALADARQAFDAGMGQAAVATFTATMRLAGIQVAREFLEMAA